MEEFIEYLNTVHDGFNTLHLFKNIKIVLGNESCDLDSTISTLLLGFFIYSQLKKNGDQSVLVLPVMNVDEEYFPLRTENCYVLKKSGIEIEKLIFRDKVNIDEILNEKHVETYLVDHHILADRDMGLKDTVVRIIDHRPIDSSISHQLEKIEAKIIEVGSCATLIADEMLAKNETILTKECALLLYETIIFDTIGLAPENGRAKALDINVTRKLEEKFKYGINRKELFDELWSAHNNVSHLSPKQLLYKDLKIVDGVPVPGLPILCEDYLKLENSLTYIKEFVTIHNSSLIVLVGLDAKEIVRRDIAIYYESNIHGTTLKDIFIENLLNCRNNKNYDLELSEIELNIDNIKCFRQNCVKLSRKQIIPLLKDSVAQYRYSK